MSILFPPTIFRHATFNLVLICIVLGSVSIAASVDPSPRNAHFIPRQSTYANQNSSTNETASQNETLRTIRESVHCYALPYGGLGFGSHILTYYCIIVNAYGRRPIMPWKRQEYQYFDLIIGFLQLVGTTISGTLTVTRCSGDTRLQLLGIWMVLTSAASSIAAMFGHGRWLCAGSRSREMGGHAMAAPSTVTYNPDGYPAPTYSPTSPPQNFEYAGQPQPYYDPYKPHPTAMYYSTPQYESVNMRGGSGGRRFFSRDGTDYRANGNKYGQWLSWGSIISIWLIGCFIGFIGSVNIALRVWTSVKKVQEITKWFSFHQQSW
jgi:hypothetical protein